MGITLRQQPPQERFSINPYESVKLIHTNCPYDWDIQYPKSFGAIIRHRFQVSFAVAFLNASRRNRSHDTPDPMAFSVACVKPNALRPKARF